MDIGVPEKSGMSTERLRRIDDVMRRYIDEGKIPGIQTLVYRRGQVVQWGCYGEVDLAEHRPTRPDTLYRIYSMTKPITCTAVMMLWEEGRLRPSDPVAAYIPAFKDLQVFAVPAENGSDRQPLTRPMLIHDLLTHTAGLAYGLDEATPVDTLYRRARLLRSDETLADKIQRLAQFPLLYQPGTNYSYSMAIDVLGYLVEVISGQTLDVFFQKRIFEPLGMVDTAFNLPPAKLERVARCYLADEQGRLIDLQSPPGSEGRAAIDKLNPGDEVQGPYIDKAQPFTFLSAGGGLTSTLPDYLRFARMLLNGGELDGVRILGRQTAAHMALNQLPEGLQVAPGVGMGYGLGVVTDPARAMLLASPGAFGWGGAAGTEFWVDRREDLLAIIMLQILPGAKYPVQLDFRTLVNQAVVD